MLCVRSSPVVRPMPANQLRQLAALDTHDLPADWQVVLQQPALCTQLDRIRDALAKRLGEGAVIFPQDPWYALRLTPLKDVRVVILGQDPYHGPNQAHGLAFSVDKHCPTPPSLRNIFKEIARSLPNDDLTPPRSNDLSDWARQGVLLLNTTLTVEQGAAASHARLGWQIITDQLIAAVAAMSGPKVFMLWGKHAQEKRVLIEQTRQQHPDTPYLVIEANHPSPLSANRPPQPFIGCDHFLTCQQWLHQHAESTINW